MAGALAPRPAPARLLAVAAIAAALAGCASDSKDPRPATKPDELGVAVVQKGKGGAKLTRGRVSTKSGDILILEPDGSVTEVALDSPSGRDAFDVSEEELAALSVNLGLDLSAPLAGNFNISPRQVRRGPTAQEKALEAFAARTQPALPRFPAGFQADPEVFLGTQVQTVRGDERGSLVEVIANLKPGVDADVALAYATCALAGWAEDEGQDYARHIRTLQDKRRGMLLVGAVFTLSDSKPMGLRVMETSDTLRECKDRGFPAA
ncbi:hypothetical protein KTN05_10375 [Paracoccus sp. Z118]|uniref:hypothetical protein n=1 Tax=Paracoccus sp. Z118 TaxID=2851017 RepID=UPI001C2C93F7|nr:hypothetical protein [Paracoccus sp. Z118]MBV0892258.1 hypothetical protein [Paracoccus sp. Z118]